MTVVSRPRLATWPGDNQWTGSVGGLNCFSEAQLAGAVETEPDRSSRADGTLTTRAPGPDSSRIHYQQ